MGNSATEHQHLDKGEGLRIIKIHKNSPFRGKVEEFFDFIVDIIPPPQQKSAQNILDKLSNQPKTVVKKSPLEILNENIGKVIKVQIVSTKYRKKRTEQINLNNQVEENSDKIGITCRKERFDEVFDTYFPVADVQNNSPVKKAGIREGQFLIGCLEYSYRTIDAFMEGLYQRYFDKEVEDKSVHLILYDIVTDSLIVKEVVLRRGWGGKGLLGCQFLQGILNKFPHNLEGQRRQLREKENKKRQIEKLRNELGDCDGASKSLIESLQIHKNKKGKHFKNIKNLLNIQPPKIESLEKKSRIEEQIPKSQAKAIQDPALVKKVGELESRVALLQQALYSVKEYISKMELIEEKEAE